MECKLPSKRKSHFQAIAYEWANCGMPFQPHGATPKLQQVLMAVPSNHPSRKHREDCKRMAWKQQHLGPDALVAIGMHDALDCIQSNHLPPPLHCKSPPKSQHLSFPCTHKWFFTMNASNSSPQSPTCRFQCNPRVNFNPHRDPPSLSILWIKKHCSLNLQCWLIHLNWLIHGCLI